MRCKHWAYDKLNNKKYQKTKHKTKTKQCWKIKQKLHQLEGKIDEPQLKQRKLDGKRCFRSLDFYH